MLESFQIPYYNACEEPSIDINMNQLNRYKIDLVVKKKKMRKKIVSLIPYTNKKLTINIYR